MTIAMVAGQGCPVCGTTLRVVGRTRERHLRCGGRAGTEHRFDLDVETRRPLSRGIPVSRG